MATDALSLTFSALADPTRRAILARLASGSATVKELSEPFDMSGPAVSKHLRVLERAQSPMASATPRRIAHQRRC
jgi:DNA-binding transcriptional ArsR family regulator